ncbi:MAG: fimbrillin family protein [Bacteroidales bacterium]|jgi:hypothetical protein|nr:fimbrillin family protein [Bacteroidales bacterium]MDD2263860.1 fimbrillin family protein [Bacteroidales bacterium]MDD2830923.1 fimbrillin family protein [Bacteroidales bacterium]MDD3208269.1 fimbrillin family protein [Bacteroidales bacterium]MDD3696689.1 fimbrillin family protein [Bacteroidales bacterium]
MKTKKFTILCAICAMVLMSCSGNEILQLNQGEGIRFRTSVNVTTRATTTLSNLGTFHVTAYNAGQSANYFTNLAVTSSDNGVTWQTASTYYWPSYSLNFVAYAPAAALQSKVTINKTTQNIADFTPETSPADQKDVVIAFNTGNQSANGVSGVAMNFKHILSQIEVKAKCSNPNMKIEVIGVKICRIPSTATFTFPLTETNAAYTIPEGNWSAAATQKDFVINGTSAVTLTGTEQNIMFGTDNFILIPQQLVAWAGSTVADNAYLSVLCRISNDDGGGTYTQLYPPTANLYGYSAVPVSTKWLAGKKYIYTLEFCGTGGAGGGGQVDPSPTDPSNPSNPNVDTTPGTGGDPILGGPIKFTVTVDNWTDVASNLPM